MSGIITSRHPRAGFMPARGRSRRSLLALTGMLLALALPAALSSSVQAAENPFCLPGEGAGQCNNPNGLATDFETGHVYVADKGNNRLDVFEADVTSIGAIGSAQLTNPK